MVVAVLLFIAGLILLIKGGDWFVDGAVGVARRFRLPEILIGATVVSIGTTLPEVMVSATSAVQGQSEMSYGNAIGSIICNTALIAAVSIVVRPSAVHRRSLRLPVVFFFLAAIFYIVISYALGSFPRPVGLVLLGIFAVYMVLAVRNAKRSSALEPTDGQAPGFSENLHTVGSKTDADNNMGTTAVQGDVPEAIVPAESTSESQTQLDAAMTDARRKRLILLKDLALLIVGAVLIAVGARWLVKYGTEIAVGIGVPSTVIALTFVALGTSLPELITAITSLAKGHSSLSLGNIIGANLFNIVWVCGMSITLRPFDVPATSFLGCINTSLLVDIPLMLTAMLILVVPALIRGKLARWQGVLLLSLYAAFCVFQFAI